MTKKYYFQYRLISFLVNVGNLSFIQFHLIKLIGKFYNRNHSICVTQMGSSPSASLQAQSALHNEKKKQFRIEQLNIDERDEVLIIQIMKSHCLLSILTDKQRSLCIQYFSKWVYSSGRYIYRQHDIPQQMFLISKGSVSVQIDCSIVKSLGQKEYFGHDTVCFDSPRSESIRVITSQITVFAIKKEDIMPIIQQRMEDYKEDINVMFNRIHFFNYLTNKQRKFLINSTQLFKLNKNEILFERQQDANSFYVIKKNTITIQIDNKKDIVMKEGDYFGQSAFLQLLNNSNKSQRMGRAIADQDGSQVYAIGLSPVKICLGYYIRSIIFFNQQKWALFRNQFLNSLPHVDYNYLLQLFNVKEGKKYSVLAKRGTKAKYIFIPLQVQINRSRQLKIYGAQLINAKNEQQSTLAYDIILTDNGYYAYALLEQIRQVLSLKRTLANEIQIKLLKQPLYMNMTLTLRNLSKYSKKLPSSDYSIVLIVQDMKFGNEFIVKIYKKKKINNPISNSCFPEMVENIRSLKSSKVINYSNDKTLCSKIDANKTSIKSIFDNNRCQSIQKGKIILDEKMIVRQKNLAAELCSNYVCGYYKAQQDENNYYLFFEYIIGTKLQDIITNFGKIPYKVIKYYLASMADALSYLHSQQIVYRNLNPNDIIIKNNGKLVLIDFSCSKRLNQTHKTATLTGTPFYMAPEIIREHQYTYNSDIWSMGIILYEMITGGLPFGQGLTDPMEIYGSIMHCDLDLKIIQNKNEKDILKRLLEKDPQKRIKQSLQIRNFAYISDLQFEWDAFLKGNLAPSYFPPSTKTKSTNIINYQIFDASIVNDWN